MANIYNYGINTENLENKALMVTGTASATAGGLASLIAGVSALPVIGIIGGGILAFAGLVYYARNKIYSKTLNDYFQNSKKNDLVELKYKIDKKGNIKTNLPDCVKFSDKAKTYLDTHLKNGNNNCYKIIIRKVKDNEYEFAIKLNDLTGAPVDSPKFDFDLVKYQNYSLPKKKNKQKVPEETKKNPNMTDQELLAKIRRGNGTINGNPTNNEIQQIADDPIR